MSTENKSKINRLLTTIPSGVVLTSAWLTENGYSPELQKRYKRSKWLDSIARGAMVRHCDTVNYLGAVYAMQRQMGLSIHPGAKTALQLSGKSHYLEFSTNKIYLFSAQSKKLPAWFTKHNWNAEVTLYRASFLPTDIGLITHQHKTFEIEISGPARAIMECLYLVPETLPILEAYELIEGLNNLRPKTVQQLLESCTSVKVKRLFLYMAEKTGHDWFNYLNLNTINLGEGKRQLVPDGIYISKYQITVPKELEKHV